MQMLPDMAILLELQELDKECHALKEQLRKYPDMWEKIKGQRDQGERVLQTVEHEEEDFQRERRRIDAEIRFGKDLLKRYESQITLIRTQRDFAALSTQIDQTRLKITKLEEEREGIVQREQEVTDRKNKILAECEEVRKKADEERKRFREQIRRKKERIADIMLTRKDLEAKVESKMLTAYTRLLVRWPGTVVAPVRGKSCSGCHFAILPQKLVEIHREEGLVHCDNCGRMISEDQDYKPGAAPGGDSED